MKRTAIKFLIISSSILLHSCNEPFFNYRNYSKEQIKHYLDESYSERDTLFDEDLIVAFEFFCNKAWELDYNYSDYNIIELKNDTVVKADVRPEQRGLGGCVAAIGLNYPLSILKCNFSEVSCLRSFYTIDEPHYWRNIQIKGRPNDYYDNEDGKITVHFDIIYQDFKYPIIYFGEVPLRIHYAAANSDGGFSKKVTGTLTEIKLIVVTEEAMSLINGLTLIEPEEKLSGIWGVYAIFGGLITALVLMITIGEYYERRKTKC